MPALVATGRRDRCRHLRRGRRLTSVRQHLGRRSRQRHPAPCGSIRLVAKQTQANQLGLGEKGLSVGDDSITAGDRCPDGEKVGDLLEAGQSETSPFMPSADRRPTHRSRCVLP